MGFTLVELMIASSLSMLLVSLAISLSSRLHTNNAQLQLSSMIEDDMRAIQSVLTQTISKANYTALTSVDLTGIHLSPVDTINLSAYPKEKHNSCITFGYDKNNDGTITAEDNELLGYRLRNNAIEYRVEAKACSEPGWFDLTDVKSISINQLSFSKVKSTNWGTLLRVEIVATPTTPKGTEITRIFSVGVPNAI